MYVAVEFSYLVGRGVTSGLSTNEHMNNYTNLLTDLANVDVVIEEKDKA